MKNIVASCCYIFVYFIGFVLGLITFEVDWINNTLFKFFFSSFLVFMATNLELQKKDFSSFGILIEVTLLVALSYLGQMSFLLVKEFYIDLSPRYNRLILAFFAFYLTQILIVFGVKIYASRTKARLLSNH